MIEENKEKLTFAINQICIQNCDGSVNMEALKAIRYIQEVINHELPENGKVPYCDRCNIGSWFCNCANEKSSKHKMKPVKSNSWETMDGNSVYSCPKCGVNIGKDQPFCINRYCNVANGLIEIEWANNEL